MKTRSAFTSLLLAGSLVLTGCPDKNKQESIKKMNSGASALSQKQFDTAIQNYKDATALDRDNDNAWYGLGASYMGRDNWAEASDSYQHAVQIRNTDPMYQMWLGISLYEKAVKQAKEEMAKKLGKKVEEVKPDLSTVNFDTALQPLQQASKINPEMWRAQYYLGKIYAATEKPQEAAEAFTHAIQENPREAGPYIALGELYRHWDFADQAIQVPTQGAAAVPGASERSNIWYVLGMAYNDKRLDDKSIEAFTKAIEDKKDNHRAQFQRGQAYFHKGDLPNAKKDLGEFVKSGAANDEFNKTQANKLLMDIASHPADGSAPAAPAAPAVPPHK